MLSENLKFFFSYLVRIKELFPISPLNVLTVIFVMATWYMSLHSFRKEFTLVILVCLVKVLAVSSFDCIHGVTMVLQSIS